MSGLRSRLSHFVLSATVATVACAGIAVPASEARDGRSRTSIEPIIDMPGPNRHDSENLIVDMPPMHPIRAAKLPGQERKEAETLTAAQKSARANGKGTKAAKADRASQPAAAAAPATATAPQTPNLAASGAPDTSVSQAAPKSGFDFDAASNLTPGALSAVVSNAPPANEIAPPTSEVHDADAPETGVSVVANLKPAAEPPSPFAVKEEEGAVSSVSLDAKPNFEIVQQMALGEDAIAPNTPNELAETIALKGAETGDATEKNSSVVNVAVAAPTANVAPAAIQSADASASTYTGPNIFFNQKLQRNLAPRAQTGSALSREIEQVANSVPPMQFELPSGKEERAGKEDRAGVAPPPMRPMQVSGGFQWRMPSLAAKPKEEVKEQEAAEPAKPDDEVSAAARKAEQERKDAVWAKIAKAQAESKAKAAAQAAKDPDAENQLPLFRVIKKMMHPEARNDEERAYANLLKEGIKGPIRVRLGDRATLWLPSGYVYIDAERAREAMDGEAGLADPNSQGVILPDTRTPTWMAYVDLLDDGYVSEENAKNMNPASLLLGVKSSVEAQNSERAHYGVAPLTVDRWIKPPQLVAAKHDLNACVSAIDASAADPSERLVNCFSYALGRRGALKILVTGEESNIAAFEHEAAGLTEHITFDQGQAYKDYAAGQDGVAEYGAAELVGGVTGLKSIAAVAAAAGAGKNQELFLTRILSYWEEILTALVIVFLGARWMQANREEEREQEEDLRATPRTSFFRLASSRLGAVIRGLFETEEIVQHGAVMATAVGAERQTAKPEAKPASAEKKSLLANLREKASKLPLPMLRTAAKDQAAPAEAAAQSQVETAETASAAIAPAPAGKFADLRAKLGGLPLLARFKKAASASPAPASAATAQAARSRRGAEVAALEAERGGENVGANANKLSKLASLMRKKVEAPAPAPAPAPAALSRLAAKREPAQPEPVAQAATPPVAKEAPAALAVAEPAKEPRPEPALSTSVADILDLVEPGDAQATSIAREALQQAHG